jgi:hypothetical protein
MKNIYFIFGLSTLIIGVLFVSMYIPIQEGASANTPIPSPPSDTVKTALNTIQNILNGKLVLDATDADYLSYIKNNACYLPPPANGTFVYQPLGGTTATTPGKGSSAPTKSQSFPVVVQNLFLKIQDMLSKSSFATDYPYNTYYQELVFYTAYINKLNININTVVSSKNENSNKKLMKILDNYKFIYSEKNNRTFNLHLDEVIFYLNILLAHAFDTGKYKSKIEADFICNFATINSTNVGILQKIVPPLINNLTTIGFMNIPASLEIISLSPLNSSFIAGSSFTGNAASKIVTPNSEITPVPI